MSRSRVMQRLQTFWWVLLASCAMSRTDAWIRQFRISARATRYDIDFSQDSLFSQGYCNSHSSNFFQLAAESRRRFLHNVALPSACTAVIFYHSGAAAVAEDDPFAKLDSIASAIAEGSSTGIESFPLAKSNNSVSDTSTKVTPSNDSFSRDTQTRISEMEAALEESRKRKRIDPRTHG